MKKKLFLSVALVVVFGCVLFQTGLSAAADKPIVIKGVTFQHPTTDRSKVFDKFMQTINERAKGRLDAKYLGGPEVTLAPQQPQAVRTGSVQMAGVGGSHLKGLVPEAQLLALSRIDGNAERTGGANAYLQKRFEKAGLYYVGRLDPKMEQNWPIYMTKPVRKVDDFKGFRLGANGTYVKAMAEALGTSFSVFKMEDTFGALDRGMVVGYVVALGLAQAQSLFETAKYILDHPIYRSNTSIIMNLDTWKKMPKDLQKLIQDTYIEMEPDFIAASMLEVTRAEAAFKKAGVEFIKFSPEEEAKYYDICYEAEAKRWMKELPETAEEYLKLVKAIK
jgi:TRAP-type C4-dicarboxylate transport system substrate-binding protein